MLGSPSHLSQELGDFRAQEPDYLHFATDSLATGVVEAFPSLKMSSPHQPSDAFGVTTEQATAQLRALLDKANKPARPIILDVLIYHATPVPNDPDDPKNSRTFSHNKFKSVFAAFEVELQDTDLDFVTTLNYSRATAKSAMEGLKIEYPTQGHGGLTTCGSSYD